MIEVGGAFAGCVALSPAEEARWLEHFYLDPRAQGRGVSRPSREEPSATVKPMNLSP